MASIHLSVTLTTAFVVHATQQTLYDTVHIY